MVSRALGIISARPTHPIFHGIDPFPTDRKCKQWWNLREGRSIMLSGFRVTLISAAMLDVAWYSLIITMSKRPDYYCSAPVFSRDARDVRCVHRNRFGRGRRTSYRYFLHRKLHTCTSSDFARANCKRELRGLKSNRTRMGEHACDYLSSRNALSAIKRIINKTMGDCTGGGVYEGEHVDIAAINVTLIHLLSVESYLTNY